LDSPDVAFKPSPRNRTFHLSNFVQVLSISSPFPPSPLPSDLFTLLQGIRDLFSNLGLSPPPPKTVFAYSFFFLFPLRFAYFPPFNFAPHQKQSPFSPCTCSWTSNPLLASLSKGHSAHLLTCSRVCALQLFGGHCAFHLTLFPHSCSLFGIWRDTSPHRSLSFLFNAPPHSSSIELIADPALPCFSERLLSMYFELVPASLPGSTHQQNQAHRVVQILPPPMSDLYLLRNFVLSVFHGASNNFCLTKAIRRGRPSFLSPLVSTPSSFSFTTSQFNCVKGRPLRFNWLLLSCHFVLAFFSFFFPLPFYF